MNPLSDIIRSVVTRTTASKKKNAADETNMQLAPLELTAVGKAIRIFMIGDSHCLPSRDLLVTDKYTGRGYLVISKYIPGLHAAGMMVDGNLAPGLVAALENEQLIRDGHFTFASLEQQDVSTSFAAGTPGSPPILVLTAGDIDLRSKFLPQLKDEYDLILPYETPYGVREGSKIMPYSVARRAAQKAFAPIAKALERLKKMGLPRLMVAELPPPSLDQAYFDKLHGFTCPLDTRYKATVLFNEVLREACAQVGVKVVSIWSEIVDERGYLRHEFELDGVHLNREACLAALRQIIAGTISESLHCVNARRYELAYTLRQIEPAGSASAKIAELVREFHETGICRTEIPTSVADILAEKLDYTLDMGNHHARVDWFGNTVAPVSTQIKAAAPSQDFLDLLHETLYGQELSSLVQGCMGGDVWYANCRPFLSLPHQNEGEGPQAFHHDGCPPHVLRAIIYLVDVDEENGPFEYLAADGSARRILGPRGTTFIFDANRLRHRATPPRIRERRSVDFVILPRMKSQERRLLWAGLNNWPGDPFNFSVNGMRASPPCSSDIMEVNPLKG